MSSTDIRQIVETIVDDILAANYTECETCGCVIANKVRNEGPSITKTVNYTFGEGEDQVQATVEVDQLRYYCKLHLPKEQPAENNSDIIGVHTCKTSIQRKTNN